MTSKRTVAIWLGLAGVLAIGGIMAFQEFTEKGKDRHLRVAFPSLRAASTYDPAKIGLSYEYIFLENVYSPLVEVDPKGGMIQPGLAEQFEWVGNDLRFKIRKDQKTRSGALITPEDVVFSLKRVLVLASNTHGNFKDLICPEIEFKSIGQECPGILHDGDTVTLRPRVRKPFLLPMLASIDFAIIPRASVDPKTLQIINYHETSGPYYVEQDRGSGAIVLRANPSHYHYSSDIPQGVEFLPIDTKSGATALQAFEAGKVDHILTTNSSKVEDVIEYAREHTEVQLHATMKIRSLVLVFTERGVRELAPEKRRFIGKQIREAFQQVYGGKAGFKESNEFFPGLGHGGLSREQEEEVSRSYSKLDEDSNVKFRLGLIRAAELESWAIPIRERLPEAEVYRETTAPDFQTYAVADDIPHAFIANTDTGFLEDISLITYSLSAGLFGMRKDERQSWLVKYMQMEAKEDRMTFLRGLHAHALTEPVLVPLIISPFVALARKPWRMELSELYANNPLWLIKHD